MKQGKVWGSTELLLANGVLEFHRIEFNAGAHCSQHKHEFKFNGFFVETGEMKILTWQDDKAQAGMVDETILKAGDFTVVRPGLFHQFIGVKSGVAFELYWAQFDHNDIVRRTQGGHK